MFSEHARELLTQQVQEAQADLHVQVAQPQAATWSPILNEVGSYVVRLCGDGLVVVSIETRKNGKICLKTKAEAVPNPGPRRACHSLILFNSQP